MHHVGSINRGDESACDGPGRFNSSRSVTISSRISGSLTIAFITILMNHVHRGGTLALAAQLDGRRLAEQIVAEPFPSLGVARDGPLDRLLDDLSSLLRRYGLGQHGEISGLRGSRCPTGSATPSGSKPTIAAIAGNHDAIFLPSRVGRDCAHAAITNYTAATISALTGPGLSTTCFGGARRDILQG